MDLCVMRLGESGKCWFWGSAFREGARRLGRTAVRPYDGGSQRLYMVRRLLGG